MMKIKSPEEALEEIGFSFSKKKPKKKYTEDEKRKIICAILKAGNNG